MKDYQQKALEEITDLFNKINQISYNENSLIQRLSNQQSKLQAAKLQDEASLIAAHAAAYAIAKPYYDNVLIPVMNHFFQGHQLCSLHNDGRISLQQSYRVDNFSITPFFKYTAIEDTGKYTTMFVGFHPPSNKLSIGHTTDMNEFTDSFEKWVNKLLRAKI